MSSQPHLEIFTVPSVRSIKCSTGFPLFPRLPRELRLKIWQQYLHHQRILRVLVDVPIQAERTNSDAVQSTSDELCIVFDGKNVLSKLLRVNSEARDEALAFYRVHIPCRLTTGGVTVLDGVYSQLCPEKTTKRGVIHFNPEYDFLYIRSASPVKNTLVQFLSRLKTTYDPRHIGLLNLAVDLKSLNENDLSKLQRQDLDSNVRMTFLETLMQLEAIIFVTTTRTGRQMNGWQSCLSHEVIFNRSLPIMTRIPGFEVLNRDPRSIGKDLGRIFIKTFNPKYMVSIWEMLIKKLNIAPRHTQFRFLLAHDAYPGPICDRRSAEAWLQKDDNTWNGRCQVRGDSAFTTITAFPPPGAFSEEYRNEDLEAAVKPAFGFWLFSIDSLDAFHDTFRGDDKVDLTEHWPELALFNLP